jgi:hypothetical protein
MKASLKILTLCLLLIVPFSAAHAQGPSLSPIANVTMNAGGTLDINVIAVDAENRPVTVTAVLPPFATLHTPTIGTGIVVTHLTLAPSTAQVGDYSAAVTAMAGGVSTVRVFQITVNAAGSNQAPIVTAPALPERLGPSRGSDVHGQRLPYLRDVRLDARRGGRRRVRRRVHGSQRPFRLERDACPCRGRAHAHDHPHR